MKRPDNYEIVKSFISDIMVVETAIPAFRVRNKVKDAGFMKTAKRHYTTNDIKEIMDDVRNEWAEQSLEQRYSARRRQLREIQFIKARLHERGDYKTLERYLRLEKDLLGTDTQEEREDAKMLLETNARIKALEQARKEEERILNAQTSDFGDYLEVISE